nr:MAG TPA: mHsp60, mHsp10, Mitochondrial, Chaperonin, Complex, Symmetric [Caudoviricetes sp.]
MNEDKLMNQSQLAESVAEKIPYTFHDCFLVKPLDKIMVKKEVTELPNSKPVKDENGVEAVEGTPKTEVKEVESDYQQGIIIKIPSTYKETENKLMSIKIGDIILYKQTRTMPFDLLKDSRLIRYFDIVAVKND